MTSRRRRRARERHTLRINADARPVDNCRDFARQFAPDLTDADLFVRIIRELDPEWNELLAHAFELAGMPPIADDVD